MKLDPDHLPLILHGKPGAVPSDSDVRDLLLDAVRLTGLTYDSMWPLPTVKVDGEALVQIGGGSHTIYGLYNSWSNVLRLRNWDPDNIPLRSILLHELVHYLQTQTHTADSLVWMKLMGMEGEIEFPAYKAQFAYLRQHDVDPRSFFSDTLVDEVDTRQ